MSIKPQLTTFDTTMITVSLVIGIGIFRVPRMVASATGSRLLFFLAWALGGLVSLMGALTFAEIGSRFSKPGAFVKVVAESYHPAMAFMLNWAGLLFVQGAGAAAVAIIGAEHLTPLLLPPALQGQTAVQVTAVALIVLLFGLNFLGIKTGAWAQNILTILKVGMILALVLAALFYRGRSLGGGAPPPAVIPPASPWWLALALGFIPVFYSYGGYQCTINLGADVRGARKNMPRAILIGILIIIACYLLINLAYIRVLDIPGLAGEKLAAARVAEVVFGRAGFLFVSLAIALSALGFLNVTMIQIPRAYYAMAQDGALPAVFRKVNPRTQTQEFTLAFFTVTILLSVFLLGRFENIVNAVIFIDSLNIACVASTIFWLRRKAAPEEEAGAVRAPLYPVLPALFVLFLFGMSVNVLVNEPRNALVGGAVLLMGLPVFLLMRSLGGKRGEEPLRPNRG